MKRFEEDEVHGDPPGTHEVAEFFLKNGNGKPKNRKKNGNRKEFSLSPELLKLTPQKIKEGPWGVIYCQKNQNFLVARNGGNKQTIQIVPHYKETNTLIATYEMLVRNGLSNGCGSSKSPVFFGADILGRERALSLARDLNLKGDRLIL